jgi:hypothetical protein
MQNVKFKDLEKEISERELIVDKDDMTITIVYKRKWKGYTILIHAFSGLLQAS